MTFLNQFHKEATERKMRKIAESQQSPMSSADFANYMKRNLELAKRMCPPLSGSSAWLSRWPKPEAAGFL